MKRKYFDLFYYVILRFHLQWRIEMNKFIYNKMQQQLGEINEKEFFKITDACALSICS